MFGRKFFLKIYLTFVDVVWLFLFISIYWWGGLLYV